MRIWKVDDKEQTTIPDGVGSDGIKVPICPNGYAHKLEYLDTHDVSPVWRTLCDNRRNFQKELANIIHGKQCHASHEDQCSYYYVGFAGDDARMKYQDKAFNMLRVLDPIFPNILNTPAREERIFQLASDILSVL